MSAPSSRLEDAVRTLIVYIRQHRTTGDGDLDLAVKVIEEELSGKAGDS